MVLLYHQQMIMKDREITNYERIADAITYISTHFKSQPSLDEVAAHIHLSPFHFQRLFTEWAGVSPKKFLQYISLEHARKMLKEQQATLSDTALETGLSGIGRLHDLFIRMEGMTPGEYKNGGEALSIRYSFADTPFGQVLIASTPKGICHLAFTEEEHEGLSALQAAFPKAFYIYGSDALHSSALQAFHQDQPENIRLHLKGSPFQLNVWQALLRIPAGKLSTYGTIARQLEQPGASRAVGTAIGDNPVAYLIPCHRVIRSSGLTGEYHWGSSRKKAMIGWEATQAGKL